MTDLARTTFYDSHHFKAVGQPEKYDVALRIWKLGPVEAEAQYKKLKESLPEAVEKNELATKSLRAGTDDILAIAWWDATRGVVAQISCGSAQCANHEAALKIAKLVEDRLDKLGQKEPVKTEEEIGPPKEEQQPLKLSPPELKP